jgi:hypothetical protein
MPDIGFGPARSYDQGLAVVLGTSDIASAIGWHLQRAGHAVLLLRDAAAPVLRRGMAFDDALEAGTATLEGVTALAQGWPGQPPGRGHPLVARDNLAVALAAFPAGSIALLVDARLRKYVEPEDLRSLAALAIGVGPGFVVGQHVHRAVESLPGAEGQVISAGPTAIASGQAVPLGGAGSERFVYTTRAGAWRAARAIGELVAAGECLGTLGGEAVPAPLAGCIRGLVRSCPGLPRGAKLAEIDPQPEARWQGMPPRVQRIAAGVLAAVASAMEPVEA